MPNWCANSLELEFKSAEQAKDFVESYIAQGVYDQQRVEDELVFHFSRIIPVEGDIDIIRLSGAWGTKWEPIIDLLDCQDQRLWMQFDSAWGPPDGIYSHLWANRAKYGITSIEADFAEGGMCLCGRFVQGDYVEYTEGTDDYNELMQEYGYELADE